MSKRPRGLPKGYAKTGKPQSSVDLMRSIEVLKQKIWSKFPLLDERQTENSKMANIPADLSGKKCVYYRPGALRERQKALNFLDKAHAALGEAGRLTELVDKLKVVE